MNMLSESGHRSLGDYVPMNHLSKGRGRGWRGNRAVDIDDAEIELA